MLFDAPSNPEDNAPAPFRYVDLFAGIGGFAAVLSGMGGEPVYSVEIDKDAAEVYRLNWGHAPNGAKTNGEVWGDITQDANDNVMNVPPHEVLAAGFPCQPFSKSGAQMGMDETRGTLFWNILKIVQAHHPKVLLLENVRNLAGPRHKHEWDVIIERLKAEGYAVSETPTFFSPHLLPLEAGGRPQIRERVFITATYDPDGVTEGETILPPVRNESLREGEEWDVKTDLPLSLETPPGTELTAEETRWITAWDEWVKYMWTAVRRQAGSKSAAAKLPGFPVWADAWVLESELVIPPGTPAWKENFLRKNSALYTQNQAFFDAWAAAHRLDEFPPSRRKLEWQAQDTPTLWDCVMQMRPSGIRAKRATHLPALVAITQTSIYGPARRRLSPTEVARLQGLPDSFNFGSQKDSKTLKQLGNGVNIGAVWHVLKAHVARDEKILERDEIGRNILKAVQNAPITPDDVIPDLLQKTQIRTN